jgi:hypothetical protein
VLVDRAAGELGARCDDEAYNTLTLNLAQEIVTGKRNVEEARKFYAETASAYVMGASGALCRTASVRQWRVRQSRRSRMLSPAGKLLPPHRHCALEVVIFDDNFDPGNLDFKHRSTRRHERCHPGGAETTLGRIAAASNAAHNDPNACRRCRHEELTVDGPTSGDM